MADRPETKKNSRIDMETYYPDSRFYLLDLRCMIARNSTIMSPYHALSEALEKAQECLALQKVKEAQTFLKDAETHANNFFDAAGRWQRTAEELGHASISAAFAICHAANELFQTVEHPASLQVQDRHPPQTPQQPAPKQRVKKSTRKAGGKEG